MREVKSGLGSEVRRLRERAGLTQEQLAERVGLETREAISRIERGLTRRPDDKILLGFEQHIGLSQKDANALIVHDQLSEEDLRTEILRIAAIADYDERLEAWGQLSDDLRPALMQYAQDVLKKAARQS